MQSRKVVFGRVFSLHSLRLGLGRIGKVLSIIGAGTKPSMGLWRAKIRLHVTKNRVKGFSRLSARCRRLTDAVLAVLCWRGDG